MFLDIEGAFDNASFSSKDTASCEYRVDLTLRRWIEAFEFRSEKTVSRMPEGGAGKYFQRFLGLRRRCSFTVDMYSICD
jgi:hypothetical protein